MTENGSIILTYREALKSGLRAALTKNDQAFLMGEDVGRYGGAFAISKGLLQEFGPERIMDVPLCESGFVGAAIGAALSGMRPIVELMTVNFSLLSMDQIVNNAATLLHMSGGQLNVPLIIRMGCGIGRQLAAQHSHSWEPLYAHIPGLKVLSAGTHEDARGMLLAAMDEPDPVIIFEYTFLLNREAELPLNTDKVDIKFAKLRRAGQDITIITYGAAVYKVLEAAAQLAEEGMSAEVIDLRVLRPLDNNLIFSSIKKTHRVLIVEEAWGTVSISSELSARITENVFYDLDAPVYRLCGAEVPMPYPKHLEDAALPQVKDIFLKVKKILQHD